MVGTPRTHARFLNRHEGSYGPSYVAGVADFPSPKTPVPGLWRVGDGAFPGIGVPAVAASGMITAHSILDVQAHWANLDKLRIR